MGRVGSAYDNAAAESLFATIKRELVNRHRFPTRGAARAAIFEFVEVFYNRQRLHSSVGYLSPAEFERRPTTRPRRLLLPNRNVSTRPGQDHRS